MKRVFIFFFLFVAGIIYVTGQEDTLKSRNYSSSESFFSDSLKLQLNKDNPLEPIDDYRKTYDELINPKGDKHTSLRSFSVPKSKSNIINSTYFKFIIPTTLISYGLIAQKNKKLQELDQSVNQEITKHFPGKFYIDDYMQYTPYIAYYSLDLCGVKAKHNFRDRTIVLSTSILIMTGTVQGMKRGFAVRRPDGSAKTSFPSGHAATAFLGAHLLFREYNHVSPWIGITGYATAATVGYMRVRNKRHWVSDVVAGAGIGILSAEVGYLLLPVCHRILGIKSSGKNLMIAPIVGANNYGVGLAYTF